MNLPCDVECRELVGQILQHLPLLNRHDMIRSKSWLQKLQAPVINSVWKQNRNLYLRILLEMQKEGALWEPFNHSPPEGPLPKISLYDVPYPIRIRISQGNKQRKYPSRRQAPSFSKTAWHSRKNSSVKVCEKYLSRRNSLAVKSNTGNQHKAMEHKRKIVFGGLVESPNRNGPDQSSSVGGPCSIWQQETQNLGNENRKFANTSHNLQTMKTEFLLTSLEIPEHDEKTRRYPSQFGSRDKGKENYPTNGKQSSPYDSLQQRPKPGEESQPEELSENQEREGMRILKKCLKLFASEYENLSHRITYKQLLEDIVHTGEAYGENMRDISFEVSPVPCINAEGVHRKRVKEKFTESGQHYLQFMSYLHQLH